MSVVHLEDEPQLREMLKEALEIIDPTIDMRQFIMGHDVVSYAEQHRDEVSVFFLDIRVPGIMDGLTVAQKLRELKYPGVIILTSANRPPNPETLTALRCEWLPKPWRLADVSHKLSQLARTTPA